MSNKPIIVEQLFAAPVSEVWKAITKLEQMKQWYFANIPFFKAEVGFETSFPVWSGERKFTHKWKVLEVIPPKKISYRWSYKEYEGEGIVTFQLTKKSGQTILRLTNEGLESFPQNIPEFSDESCRAGWEYFIKKNLKQYLDKKYP